LAESYTYSLSLDPGGHLWARHGAVHSISVLDGFWVRRLPEPRNGDRISWESNARIYASAQGWAWTTAEGELKELRDGRWVAHCRAPPGQTLIAAAPVGSRVIVLLDTALAEYDPATAAWRTLKTQADSPIAPFLAMFAGPREIWITGEHGMARLDVSAARPPYPWNEISGRAAHLLHFRYPEPVPGGVMAQARVAGGRTAVVEWTAGELHSVYTSADGAPRGWRGPEGDLWILDGTKLYRIVDGNKTRVPRTGVLSGNIFDVFVEDGGTFWIGSSEGIARYTPLHWQPPAGLREFDQTIHAIAEDGKGRLWFAATDCLLELDGERWKRHPIPAGLRTHAVHTDGVLVEETGRVLLKAINQEQVELVLEFDPERGVFRAVAPPGGRRIQSMSPRRAGGVWMATILPGVAGFQVDRYDQGRFLPQFESGPGWQGSDVRCLLERRNGDLWAGGISSGCAWRKRQADPALPKEIRVCRQWCLRPRRTSQRGRPVGRARWRDALRRNALDHSARRPGSRAQFSSGARWHTLGCHGGWRRTRGVGQLDRSRLRRRLALVHLL